MLIKEFQEVLIHSLNTNFENMEIGTQISHHTKFVQIYFDYNEKKILVGDRDPSKISLDFTLYSHPFFKVSGFFLDNTVTKEKIIQLLKKSILEDVVFLDYFEEKTHKLKLTSLYENLTSPTELSPLLKLLIETLPHDEQGSTIFLKSLRARGQIEYLFGKNSEENEVIHYIREIAWEQILNEQKKDLNRWLSNISYYKILSYKHIYKILLCLTHYSETIKGTELYKEVLELFKQFTFGTLKFQRDKEITTVFCSEKILEELLSYIHSYGSIGFEEFWQLLSETVGERFEVELTILSGDSLVKNVTKQSYNEPEYCPEITLLPLKQLQSWKFVKLKLSENSEKELTNNFPINNSQYHSVSESLTIQCTLKQIIDLFPTEVSEKVKEYYQLMTQVYQFSKIPDFSEFIVKDVD